MLLPILMGQHLVASGTIAAGDNKLDYTSTNAFVEFGVDLSAYQDGNHKIVVTDSAGKVARGIISGTAPGGETLGSNLAPTSCCTDQDDNQNNTNGWQPISSPTLSSEGAGPYYLKVLATIDNGYALKQISTGIAGTLYKISVDVGADNGTNGNYSLSGLGSVDTNVAGTGEGNWVSSTKYGIAISSNLEIRLKTRFAGDSSFYRNTSLLPVTDCAATGALIVSTLGGSTRSWTSVDAGFNPNLACTYAIYRVR